MNYKSTRHHEALLSFDQAIFQGLAPDGGLYVPDSLPSFDESTLIQLFQHSTSSSDLISRLYVFLLNHFAPQVWNQVEMKKMGDTLSKIPTPTQVISPYISLLKLDQGPTAAFKDVGATALAQMLSLKATHPYTVLVATSGDTGAAVASAFWKHPLARVVILFPKGRVSPMQKAQLTRFGENILSLEVDGTFDDGQRMVKEAF